MQINTCKVILPDESKSTIEFSNYRNKERVAIKVYADFECYLEKVEGANRICHNHISHSIGIYIHHSFEPEKSVYRSYRPTSKDEDTPEKWFIQQLKTLQEEVLNMIQNPKPMTKCDEKSFLAATVCHICEKSFKPGEKRVRDHCHITSLYR